jgi:ADP-ribosylglycohydrolase
MEMPSATTRGSISATNTAPRHRPATMPGTSHFRSGIDQVRGGKAQTVKGSEAETIGAIMKVAVTGSTAKASNGTPRIARPPPNAPRPRLTRKIAGKPIR